MKLHKIKIQYLFALIFFVSNASQQLQFINPKHNWIPFFKKLKEDFNISIFVETGTASGITTAQAAQVFDEVHSIELSKELYDACVLKFKDTKNVILYNGDSAKIFPKILPNLKHGKILFWLDGHWSGGITARGDLDTPIMLELEAIKKSGLNQSFIMIDDIRIFSTRINNKYLYGFKDYPFVDDVATLLNSINADYSVALIGDILCAFNKSQYALSPIANACTISRLYNGFNYSIDEVLQAEKLIAQSQGIERKTLFDLLEYKGLHYYLWAGLMQLEEGKYELAYQNLKRALDLGYEKWKYNHWRVYWYFAQAAYRLNYLDETKVALSNAIKENRNFDEAIALLNELERRL